jgi:hypothetical protein
MNDFYEVHHREVHRVQLLVQVSALLSSGKLRGHR